MPFITEELWRHLAGPDAGMLITAVWPDFPPQPPTMAQLEMDWVIGVISAIRGVRSEMNIPPGARVPLILKEVSISGEIHEQREQIERLARVELTEDTIPPARGIELVVHGDTFVLALDGIIDFPREKSRLSKELNRVDADLAKFEANLGNKAFRAKARYEVVQELEQRVEGIRRHRDRLQAAYDRLAAV
jgi:valyl-tRNA synthetase